MQESIWCLSVRIEIAMHGVSLGTSLKQSVSIVLSWSEVLRLVQVESGALNCRNSYHLIINPFEPLDELTV